MSATIAAEMAETKEEVPEVEFATTEELEKKSRSRGRMARADLQRSRRR